MFKHPEEPKTTKTKRRALGDILLDLEPLLEEMVDSHDLQWGDVLALTHSWLQVHRPGAQEEYLDGGSPIMYYGPNKVLKGENNEK